LTDYDPASNNGGWQWIDAQPKFKTFNVILQSKKYDKECLFIKTWIHELEKITNTIHIHHWYKYHKLYMNFEYTKKMLISKN
jgi:deoxyribodipyrimidine photo-lyase